MRPHALLALTLIVAAGSAVPAAIAEDVPPGPPHVAIVLDVSGPVDVRPDARGAFHAAHAGEGLAAGALMRTGPRGQAHLRWRNGGEFRLLPLGELELSEPDAARLGAGQVWARFRQKLLAPFLFRSPSATAVVRGTTLGVGVDTTGATRVAVIEGHVEVIGQASRDMRLVGPGQALEVNHTGVLGRPGPLRPEERMMPEGHTVPEGPRADAGAAKPGKGPHEPGADAHPSGTDAHQPGTDTHPPGDRAGARRASPPWRRFDDWTRRGSEWLDRQRAAERLPLLRQKQQAEHRGAPANPASTPAPGRGPEGANPAKTPTGIDGEPADNHGSRGTSGHGGDPASASGNHGVHGDAGAATGASRSTAGHGAGNPDPTAPVPTPVGRPGAPGDNAPADLKGRPTP